MGKYALNFAVSVWIEDENINKGKVGEDLTELLSENEYDTLMKKALDAIEIGPENLVCIERLSDN